MAKRTDLEGELLELRRRKDSGEGQEIINEAESDNPQIEASPKSALSPQQKKH